MKRMIWIIAGVLVAGFAAAALFTDLFYRNGTVPQAEGGPHTVAPQPVPPPQTAPPAEPDPPPEPEDPGDGYKSDQSDPDAPKTITSEQIIAFDCRFSTMDLAEEDTALGNHIFQLRAKLENGAVEGSYEVRSEGKETRFRAELGFLDEVQELAARYDVARFNGHSVEVMGLPGDYGVDLTIGYASGEHIHIHDNQDCILPLEFLEELHALFVSALPNA